MARPPFRLYEGGSAPRPAAPPLLPGVDVSSGGSAIGRALGSIGQGFERVADVNVDIQRIEHARAQDDARVDVARRMADVRRQASELRRTAAEQAPDGYRDLTNSYSAGFAQLADAQLNDPNLSPYARPLLEEQIHIFQQSALDDVAGDEQRGREQFQVDTFRSSIDHNSNTLTADPTQYESMRVDTLEQLAGMTDANLRRDMTSYMEENYARFAIGGMIQADPHGVLRALENPDAGGPYSRLAPDAREAAQRAAQNEVDRRQARWEASVSHSAQAAQRLWDLGLNAPDAPSVDSVRSALGEDAAIAYEASRAASVQFGRLSTMSMGDLVALAGDANPRDNVRDAVVHEAERRAAVQILEQRVEDPMQYQVRRGLVAESDIIAASNQGNWDMVFGVLASRGAAAMQNGARLGTAPMPLTRFEATSLGETVRRLPDAERGRFLRGAAAWMGGESPSYRALMSQLFPDSPSSAYAGWLAGVAGETASADAGLILEGEDLLGARRGSEDGQSGGGRSRLLDMPRDDDLRRAWRNRVGNAYAGLGVDDQGNRRAEEQSFQVFRSAYAALANRRGVTGDSVSTEIADRAAGIASGGVADWNGRDTLMVPGMNQSQFRSAVADAFERAGVSPQDAREYTLMSRGVSPDGRSYRYGVYVGDSPVRGAPPRTGQLFIDVRRGPGYRGAAPVAPRTAAEGSSAGVFTGQPGWR